jgi:hypothetical protein
MHAPESPRATAAYRTRWAKVYSGVGNKGSPPTRQIQERNIEPPSWLSGAIGKKKESDPVRHELNIKPIADIRTLQVYWWL